MIRVRVALEDLNRDGVILKVRYARSLKYQRNSAFINTDPNNGDYSQTQRFSSAEEQTGTTDRYLIFFFDRSLYRRNKELVAEFDLKALTPDAKAYVEVDLDKNDPNVPDTDEFSLERPLFSAIDTIPIIITGTAKPTPASGTISYGNCSGNCNSEDVAHAALQKGAVVIHRYLISLNKTARPDTNTSKSPVHVLAHPYGNFSFPDHSRTR